MVEFKSGDRVEYRDGPCLMHHGKKGEVSHITRSGWVMVKFDYEDGLIQCSEASLAKLAEIPQPDPEELLRFAVSMALADIHAESLVNPETGALMDVQSIRHTARHILKMD